MPKVLISDKLRPQAVDIFKQKGVEVDIKTGLSEEQLLEIIGEYDGLAIRSATKVTPKVLEAATKLKVVGRAGIGVDNVDVKAATSRGVIVMNTAFWQLGDDGGARDFDEDVGLLQGGSPFPCSPKPSPFASSLFLLPTERKTHEPISDFSSRGLRIISARVCEGRSHSQARRCRRGNQGR